VEQTHIHVKRDDKGNTVLGDGGGIGMTYTTMFFAMQPESVSMLLLENKVVQYYYAFSQNLIIRFDVQ
jgi:hypothetical protein